MRNRYKHQILYGCQEPNCRTPTCLSCQRRVSEGPFRKYTELSARTLACYLASLDNAENGLCRNAPELSPEFPSEGFSRSKRRSPPPEIGHSTLSGDNTKDSQKNNGAPSKQAGADIDSKDGGDDTPQTQVQSSILSSASSEVQEQPGDTPDIDGSTTQKIKDPKSFTQNLFDTLSLRMVEWLPLRRSHDTFDSDRDRSTSHLPPPRSSQGEPKSEQFPNRACLSGDASPSLRHRTHSANDAISQDTLTPSPRSVNSQPAALELKFPGQPVKRLSLSDMEHWRQTPRSGAEEKGRSDLRSVRKQSLNTPSSTNGLVSLPSPPALKHRPQKHRGLDREMNATYSKEEKKHRRVSWDGSKLLKEARNHEGQSDKSTVEERDDTHSLPVESARLRRKSTRTKSQTIPSVETLTHLSSGIVDGLSQMMLESAEAAVRWKQEIANMELSGNLEDFEWQYATPRQRQVFPFVAQSIFFSLSSTKNLLSSFQENPPRPSDGKNRESNATPDMRKLEPSIRQLLNMCPWDIVLHSLWNAVEKLFVPPKDLSTAVRSPRTLPGSLTSLSPVRAPIIPSRSSGASADDYISDSEAAYIVTVILFALVSSVPKTDLQTWRNIIQMRTTGIVISDPEMKKLSHQRSRSAIDISDRLEHELALRLVNRLVRALTARLAFYEISKMRRISAYEMAKQRKPSVFDLVLDNLKRHYSLELEMSHHENLDTPLSASAVIIEWLRTLFLKEWDGKPEMARSSAAGGAVQILSLMYKDRKRLGLEPEDFHTSFLSERLDPMEMPVEWLGALSNNKTTHLLSYSFLFPPSALVIYFRALNYSTMSKSFEAAMTATRHVTQTAFSGTTPINDDVTLLRRLRTSMSTYLVLMVRRDNVLTDALNQLWRREKRELMRPLKVQMGMDEGEEGVDHGGVQQEFFRVVFAEALSPTYGMFTIDPMTHSTWFQPCSPEPLYKYELLGLLMSLAIYNGLTLPVNFPIVLYRKLLGLKVKHLDHIQDGWPDLAKGLNDLLKWKDGDVGDIFMRTYEFSFEVFGAVRTVNMERVGRDAVWPILDRERSRERARSSVSDLSASKAEGPQYGARRRRVSMLRNDDVDFSVARESFRTGILKGVDYNTPLMAASAVASDEASLVTNQNREKFVKDYIFWLTDKSVRLQYEAFARGFYTCLDRSALSIFTPEALKTVVEGIQEIDLEELEQHARYEGDFNPTHPIIRDFWQIVKQYSPDKKRQLLEFVTASDRVPVNGMASIMFVIQKNGVGDAVSNFLFSSMVSFTLLTVSTAPSN